MFSLIDKSTRIAIYGGGVLVLVLCLIAGILSLNFFAANARVNHTTQVMTELRSSRMLLRATARAISPAEADKNGAQLMAHIDRVQQLARNNPTQQQHAQELAIRAAGMLSADGAAKSTAADAAETQIDAMQNEEYGLLAQYHRQQASMLRYAGISTAILCLALMVLGLGMTAAARSSSSRQQMTENLLKQEKKRVARAAQESTLVSAGSELVQSARDEEQLRGALIDLMRSFLPGSKGYMSLLRPSGEVLDIWAAWGESDFPQSFPQKECTALQLGRSIHRSQATHQFECPHQTQGSGDYLCLPLRGGGERIGVLQVETPSTVSRQSASTVELFAVQVALALTNLHLREAAKAQAVRDPLTGLFNRTYFDEVLDQEVQGYRHEGIPFSMLVIDIDMFKQYNDTYGHEAGNEALRGLARTLQSVFRDHDVICRYGGEEFAALMLRTGLEGSYAKAESFRLLLESAELSGLKFGFITVSVGVASGAEFASPRELAHAADAALYEAKRSGRNRVCVCTDHPDMLPTVALHIPPPPSIGASMSDPLAPY